MVRHVAVHAPEDLFSEIKLQCFTDISAQGFYRVAKRFRMAAGKPFRSGAYSTSVTAARIQCHAARELLLQRQHLLQHGLFLRSQQGAALFIDFLLGQHLCL